MKKISFLALGFFSVLIALFVYSRMDTPGNVSAAQPASNKSEEIVFIKDEDKFSDSKAKLLKDISGDYYLGNKYAPVLMIEYASLSCPHCAKFHSDILEPLLKSHIETGKLKFVYRDFPLNAPALAASKLARCSGDDSYFRFLKVLFKSQRNWAFSEDYENLLKQIGKIGGMSEEKFDECMAHENLESKILKVKMDAINILEVNSTPTVFINGIEYQGPKHYHEIAKYIDGLLKASDKK